jgi:hypothetical protein
MNNLTHRIIVARYNEDLRWLLRLSNKWEIIVYNKGSDDLPYLSDRGKLQIVKLPNKGREGGTYLYHMLKQYNNHAPINVFTQGDPFPHSPDFYAALERLEGLNTIQTYVPLTIQYLKDSTPPKHILDTLSDEERLGKLYECNARTGESIGFHDPNQNDVPDWYCNHFNIPHGANIITDYFKRMGLTDHYDKEIYQWNFAAMFAVSDQHIQSIPSQTIVAMYNSCCYNHRMFVYFYERIWHELLTCRTRSAY